MCLKKGCRIEGECLGCNAICNCNYSCYSCFDVRQNASCSNMFDNVDLTHSDIRHKFVCFCCRRVWKSYVSKYIYKELYKLENDISDYVPNMCLKNASIEEKREKRKKYMNSYGHAGYNANFKEKIEENSEERKRCGLNKFPKCAKCGKKALSVGRNFRHCKNEKEWVELECKVKKGEIDLQKDFRDYPREGKISFYKTYGYFVKISKTKQAKMQQLVDEEHTREIAKQNNINRDGNTLTENI